MAVTKKEERYSRTGANVGCQNASNQYSPVVVGIDCEDCREKSAAGSCT